MAGLPGGSPGKRSLLPVPHLLCPVLWGQDGGDPFEQVCKGKFLGWLQRPGLGTEPRAQPPVRRLGFPPEGFVSEMAFLFEPRGLPFSGRQTTGLSCHPWLMERLRPIDSLSGQREKRGKGLAATAVSPPHAPMQGHGSLTLPPRQGLPPRARGLQVETGGGPLQSPRCPECEALARRRRTERGHGGLWRPTLGERAARFLKHCEPRPGGRQGPQKQNREGQGLWEVPQEPGAWLALGAQRRLCGWSRV